MPESSWFHELNAAVDAVREGAAVAREEFSAGFSGVEDKADSTPVSNADREAETRMEKLLRKRFPKDKVIGEETATGGKPPQGRVWLLDPIDGTSNAVTGVNPLFMSQACLLVNGEPVAAAMESPTTGQLFVAERGQGSFLRKARKQVRLRVSHQTSLSRARVLVGIGSARGDGEWLARVYPKLLAFANPSSPRHFGSSAYDLCLVAAGGLSPRGADLKIDRGSQSWDLAPGVLLIEEAGGTAVDLRGNAWCPTSDSLVAGAEQVVRALLTHLDERDSA